MIPTTLRSQLGEGTVFSVRLAWDAVTSDLPSLEHGRHDWPHRFEGIPMLVVDDEREVRDSLARLLKAWGAQVDASVSAAEALELAKDRQWRVPERRASATR